MADKAHKRKVKFIKANGGCCFYCREKVGAFKQGHPKMATKDHFHPKSKGGRDIVLCCFECNQKKADMSPAQYIVHMHFGPGTRWGPPAVPSKRSLKRESKAA